MKCMGIAISVALVVIASAIAYTVRRFLKIRKAQSIIKKRKTGFANLMGIRKYKNKSKEESVVIPHFQIPVAYKPVKVQHIKEKEAYRTNYFNNKRSCSLSCLDNISETEKLPTSSGTINNITQFNGAGKRKKGMTMVDRPASEAMFKINEKKFKFSDSLLSIKSFTTSGIRKDSIIFRKTGKIDFKTIYTERLKALEVNIEKVYTYMKIYQNIHIFVRLYLVPGKKQKQRTKAKRISEDADINEKISIKLEKSEFIKHKLKFKVYHYEKMKKNELLGEMDIALSSIDITKQDKFSIEMFLQI